MNGGALFLIALASTAAIFSIPLLVARKTQKNIDRRVLLAFAAIQDKSGALKAHQVLHCKELKDLRLYDTQHSLEKLHAEDLIIDVWEGENSLLKLTDTGRLVVEILRSKK